MGAWNIGSVTDFHKFDTCANAIFVLSSGTRKVLTQTNNEYILKITVALSISKNCEASDAENAEKKPWQAQETALYRI